MAKPYCKIVKFSPLVKFNNHYLLQPTALKVGLDRRFDWNRFLWSNLYDVWKLQCWCTQNQKVQSWLIIWAIYLRSWVLCCSAL